MKRKTHSPLVMAYCPTAQRTRMPQRAENSERVTCPLCKVLLSNRTAWGGK